ncbi:ferritin [Thermosipho atlanticus]|uniref:Ferritin n=1 Tax=Thermosipho atlanticus DSM 15807 TaxID=1123380 RepID=A0A1M5SL08_9BACT|nr:ferritin [Thermosipho atlanticus]SHH39287.1 ferritin [Thermosipho atlanticus DSM 15807]
MLSEKLEKALNEQIKKEINSAYLYLSMATYFDSEGLKGFANWMKKQANEELGHAMKLYDYVYERGGEVELQAIEKPKCKWDSPLAAFEDAKNHEKFITDSIHKLFELAMEEKDYATMSMLEWFIDEQVEEEAQTEEIVSKIKALLSTPNGMYLLDKELGQR